MKRVIPVLAFFVAASPLQGSPVTPPATQEGEIQVLMEKAAQLRSQNQLPQAIETYQEALALDPANAVIQRNLGVLFYESENWEQAEIHLKESLGQKNDDPYTFLYLAKVCLKKEDLEHALFYALKGVEVNPQLEEAHYVLGVAYLERGQNDLARQAFERAKRMEPRDPRPCVGLGNLYLRSKMYAPAVEEFRQAVRLNPEEAEAYNQMGAAFYEMGRLEEAEDAFEQALMIDPENSTAMNNLGVLYLRTDRAEQARRAFGRALTVNPDNAQARENLEGLDRYERDQTFTLLDGHASPFRRAQSRDPFSMMYPAAGQSPGGSAVSASGRSALFQMGGVLLSELVRRKLGGGQNSGENSEDR